MAEFFNSLLAHTLAHAVLREAAFICGYPLPALRERIYDITDEDGGTQTALLVYTAEGDAYGTLAGHWRTHKGQEVDLVA